MRTFRLRSDEALEVFPWRDGLWRWRYRNPAERVSLSSNRSFPSFGEAAHAAALAYPGVPVADPRGAAGTRVGLAISALTVAAILLVAMIAVAGLLFLFLWLLRWGARRALHRRRRR